MLFAYEALRALTGADVRARNERGGGAQSSTGDHRNVVVRIAGHPDAHVNVMPAQDAAAVMTALARLAPVGGVETGHLETYHVVHRHELPFTAVLDALADALGIRFAVVADVADPSPLEVKAQMLSAAWAYAHHRRRYDDARVRSLVDVDPSRGRLGPEYLLAGMGMGQLGVRR
jgi:hypothetical protein